MGRTRKTYRLSDEVIQLIENRDRTAYPTATDYIEAKLNKPTKDVTELLYQVSSYSSIKSSFFLSNLFWSLNTKIQGKEEKTYGENTKNLQTVR